ncbi:hypothetical protein ACJX0J_014596, partial [Zea mays]
KKPEEEFIFTTLNGNLKGNMTITEYMRKMRSLVDDIVSIGKLIEDEELIEPISVAMLTQIGT